MFFFVFFYKKRIRNQKLKVYGDRTAYTTFISAVVVVRVTMEVYVFC